MLRWAQAVGLDEMAASLPPPESLLLFSSTSAVWSQTGAGHYAAANAYLDSAAWARQHAGLPATAVQASWAAGRRGRAALQGLRNR